MPMMSGGGAMMAIWLLLIVVLVSATTAAVVVLVRRNGRGALAPSRPAEGVESAEEVLRRRYAAGEIDEDEYFRRMSGLAQD